MKIFIVFNKKVLISYKKKEEEVRLSDLLGVEDCEKDNDLFYCLLGRALQHSHEGYLQRKTFQENNI